MGKLIAMEQEQVARDITALRARIAELEKERDKYKAADEALTARLKVDEAYTDKLEQMVRNLLREGDCLLNAAGDDGMAGETAALDWCCTAEDALELLENSHAQT